MEHGDASYSSHPPGFRPSFSVSAIRNFRVDEGFSEETRSQEENEPVSLAADGPAFWEWVSAHNEADRADIAYNVLRTLRTANVAAVVERLTPLLHIDPVQKLPPELTSEIFSLLDAPTLLTASLASQSWRARIFDSQLWKQLYADEGWGLDIGEIMRSGQQKTRTYQSENRKSKTHLRSSDTDAGQPRNKKRAPSSWFGQRLRKTSSSGSSDRPHSDALQWNEQHPTIESDPGCHGVSGDRVADAEGDEVMQDAIVESVHRGSSQNRSNELRQSNGSAATASVLKGVSKTPLDPPLRPSLWSQGNWGPPQISWPFLYKQRRRLEDNWNKGRFVNFQLPHPSYPDEAHRECVYTIQFFGKWLVSGSRDKTLRVWDLETRRLRGVPLIGHTQSVLCLQFDPTESEDVIISGSSDTNVIVWRFSTGEKIQEIARAHAESVLNLRFDERFLVTCSKDKLIKIWSRREISAADPNYPRFNPKSDAKFPTYIVDISSLPPNIMEARIANRQIKGLLPYSLLMTLDGHNAAVNAIQIDKDEIVSASGDRQIKVWNVHDGRCLKTLMGHQKGIACVQFDSKRIVSGSSDNTVRIYDHVTGAEVACLQGHSNLVRTVQAGFGDLPGAADDMRLEAEASDNRFREAVRSGEIAPEQLVGSRRFNARRNAGSSEVHDIMAVGAKLPPGGGGSQWGRIVSGSYDETIIIWKKDRKGKWVVGQRLRQEDAAMAASGNDGRATGQSDNQPTVQGPNQPGTAHPPQNNQGLGQGSAAGTNFPVLSAPQIMAQAMQTSMTGLQTGIQNVMNIGGYVNAGAAHGHNTTGNIPQTPHQTHWMAPGAQQAMHQLQNHAQNVAQNLGNQAHQNQPQTSQNQIQPQTPAHQNQVMQQHLAFLHQQNTLAVNQFAHVYQQQPQQQQHQQYQHAQQLQQAQSQLVNANVNANPIPNFPNIPQLQHPNGRPFVPPTHPHNAQPASRVFKLQFDARRIVCCSQDPRIVGWDFAAGDDEIERASKFFVGP